jgi:hypothetical protein
MKATQTLVLTLLLVLGLAGLALGRDTSDRNGLTSAASYGQNGNDMHKGRHHRGRHHRHDRHGRRRHKHGGMKM